MRPVAFPWYFLHAVPFLTLEDPNAKIKGSRDPLGVQPIWAAFGRHVVTNLTTVSTSVRGFTTLLLGRYFAADLVDRGMATREDALDIFLRMEQICAYARYVGHGDDGDIRGIERVKRFVDEQDGRVAIQADRRGMILSDQKTYGLWGLYSVSARRSGLIPEGSLDVSPDAREFVERQYVRQLNGAARPLHQLLAKGGILNTRGKDAVFVAMANMMSGELLPEEVEFYAHFLRDGLEVEDVDPERQARFRELLETVADLNEPTGRAEILNLSRRARGRDKGLATRLERIAHLEAFLAPSDALFQHLLTQGNQEPDTVADGIASHWGGRVPNLDRSAFQDLLDEIRSIVGPAIAQQMDRCHAALHDGDYEEAMLALLDWNQIVMNDRGAAPWLRYGEQGRLDVRYRGNEQLLPDENELNELWRNTYFIDALKSVTKQLEQ